MADKSKTVTVKAIKQRPAHEPAQASEFIVHCIQALAAGTATAHQQKTALHWIIAEASQAHTPPYYPTDRESTFAMGRQSPGLQLIGILKIDLLAFTQTMTKEPKNVD